MLLQESAIHDLRRPAAFRGKKPSTQPAPRRNEIAQLILSLELTSCSQKKRKGFEPWRLSGRAARNRIQGLTRQGRTVVSIALEAKELFELAGISRLPSNFATPTLTAFESSSGIYKPLKYSSEIGVRVRFAKSKMAVRLPTSHYKEATSSFIIGPPAV